MTSRGISGDGKATFVQYQARYDGKDYDMAGSIGGNKISLKRIDRLTTQSTQKRDGKPVIVATRRVSTDEKTLTVETKGTLPDGRMLESTMVFARN
jgi:sensor domain CHASE-containing protein